MKVSVNLSLPSPRRGMEVLLRSFIALALYGGEWSVSHDCFTPWGGASVLITGDLEDPRACLGVVMTRKMFCFC